MKKPSKDSLINAFKQAAAYTAGITTGVSVGVTVINMGVQTMHHNIPVGIFFLIGAMGASYAITHYASTKVSETLGVKL